MDMTGFEPATPGLHKGKPGIEPPHTTNFVVVLVIGQCSTTELHALYFMTITTYIL